MEVEIKLIKVERDNRDTKRFRRDLGDIQLLVKSISTYGLIHPIVVDKLPNDPKYQYQLVAGERRLMAFIFLGRPKIPVTIREELSDLDRKLIELEENVMRKDISWEEQTEALRQLHELKCSLHGKAVKGAVDDAGWTYEKTAKLVGASQGTVHQDIKLATMLNEQPELRKLVAGKCKLDARKIVERHVKAAQIKSRMELQGKQVGYKLLHGPAEELIKEIPTNSIGCLITDPPFAVQEISDASRGNLTGSYDRGENVSTYETMLKVYNELIPELNRVMVEGAHFYIWFGIEWYEWLVKKLSANGFLVDAVPLIWAKNRTTMKPNLYHYVPSYEFVLYGCKAPRKRTLVKPVANCIQNCSAVAPQLKVHPMQKPNDLIELFILNSTVTGEIVLDCFAGSGVVIKNALRLGRGAIGFEKDEENYLLASAYIERKEHETSKAT